LVIVTFWPSGWLAGT